jgi:2-iminobutanoate/2-iminopropanoate deaminase
MKIEKISSPNAPKAIGSYSPAIAVGDSLYCSGQLGMDPVTGELATGIRAQTDRAILNLKAVLAAAGMNGANVVKTTIYLANIADFAVVNEVYSSHFTAPFPARATVQVAALPRGGLIEIDAVAVFANVD